MMNDLEDRLRASLDRDASSAPLVGHAPAGLRRRVRRRQASIGAVTFIGVIAAVGLVVTAIGRVPAPPPPPAADRPAPPTIPVFPPSSTAEELPWSSEGRLRTASGADLGTTWRILVRPDGTVSADTGAESGTFRLDLGGFGLFNGPEGAFYVGVAGPEVERVDVVSTTGEVFRGRFLPEGGLGSDRAWIVTLPGTGHGFVLVGEETPLALSWPVDGRVDAGDVMDAGARPNGRSWWLAITEPAQGELCPALQTLQGRTTPCLDPGRRDEITIERIRSGGETIMALSVPSSVTYVELQGTGPMGTTSCSPLGEGAPPRWGGRSVCTIWLPTPAGRGLLRTYDGSGGGPTRTWPEVLPPVEVSWP